MLSGAQEAVVPAQIKKIPLERSALEGKPTKERPTKKILQSKKNPVMAEPIIEQLARKIRLSKKAQKVLKEENLVKEPKRGDMSKAILAIIQDSPEGITTTELKEKTGLVKRQIWSIIAIAKKAGKIKQTKRGVYVGV